MPPQVANNVSADDRSPIGLFACSFLAVVLFVPAFVLVFLLTYFASVTEFFVGLRDAIYAVFSGRLVRSMTLHHPQAEPRSDGDTSA